MKSLALRRRRWQPTKEQLFLIRQMFARGDGQKKVAECLGIGVTIVDRVMEEYGIEYVGPRPREPRHRDPTPAEIEERCQEIKDRRAKEYSRGVRHYRRRGLG